MNIKFEVLILSTGFSLNIFSRSHSLISFRLFNHLFEKAADKLCGRWFSTIFSELLFCYFHSGLFIVLLSRLLNICNAEQGNKNTFIAFGRMFEKKQSDNNAYNKSIVIWTFSKQICYFVCFYTNSKHNVAIFANILFDFFYLLITIIIMSTN